MGLNGRSAEPGTVLVWKACTSFTQPQSNSTVPPRFGSETSSIPCSSSPLASSTIATQLAPVRLPTAIASAKWSAWAWVISTWVGSTSSAVTFAAGLFGFRNGSTSTRVSPSTSSKREWPR